jgi:hypothetical protein
VRRAGYQLLGFVVWKVAVRVIRRRFGGAPTKIAAGAVVAAVVAALVFAVRRSGGEDF